MKWADKKARLDKDREDRNVAHQAKLTENRKKKESLWAEAQEI